MRGVSRKQSVSHATTSTLLDRKAVVEPDTCPGRTVLRGTKVSSYPVRPSLLV